VLISFAQSYKDWQNGKYLSINQFINAGKEFALVGNKKSPRKVSFFADRTGLEPATPCVTGTYSNQLNYRSFFPISTTVSLKGSAKIALALFSPKFEGKFLKNTSARLRPSPTIRSRKAVGDNPRRIRKASQSACSLCISSRRPLPSKGANCTFLRHTKK
jgi:hypothetical protein